MDNTSHCRLIGSSWVLQTRYRPVPTAAASIRWSGSGVHQNCSASSASVLLFLIAASATLALKPGKWLRLLCLIFLLLRLLKIPQGLHSRYCTVFGIHFSVVVLLYCVNWFSMLYEKVSFDPRCTRLPLLSNW